MFDGVLAAVEKQLLSTGDLTSLIDDMNNLILRNASDPLSGRQSLTACMNLLKSAVEAISSYPLSSLVAPPPSSRRLLDARAPGGGGGMRVRLSDGSGPEELWEVWRSVLNSLLKVG